MDHNKILVGTSFERTLDEQAPEGFAAYVVQAAQLFVEKSTDYEHRYLRAMADEEMNARTLWAWEVDKKLDRLRTWLKRGELQVKGEGVRNSVDDLFIYTVQYVAYVDAVLNSEVHPTHFIKVWTEDRYPLFISEATRLKPTEWVEFLVKKGRIGEDELALQTLLRHYLGESVQVEEWQNAIHALLKN